MIELNISDDDLILLIQKKDMQAVELFYDKFSPLIYGLISSSLPGSPKAAEQILYDVFIMYYNQLIAKTSVNKGLFICLYRFTLKIILENKMENR